MGAGVVVMLCVEEVRTLTIYSNNCMPHDLK